MKLGWSHTVLNIKDKKKILEFYIDTLGFKISDSGPVFENGPEIIFIRVDLPAPLGPKRPKILPTGIFKDTLFNAILFVFPS